MNLRTFILAGIMLLPSACASGPTLPLSPATSAVVLDARSLEDPRLESFMAASGMPVAGSPKTWDLQRLTLAAVYFHPDLAIADARLATAEAAIRTAAQRPNPVLGLTPQINATNPNPTAWIVGASINLLLELFGKRQARTAEATALAEAARFDVETASWQVRSNVRAAMLALWESEQRARLAAERRDLQTRLAGFVERRLAVGEASALDTARERANRDAVALAVADAARAVADARVSLATAVGIPVHALDGVAIDFAAIADARVPDDVAPLRRRALTSRADVQASLARYHAAQGALKLQLANRFPNLSLGPSYQYDQRQNKFGLNLQTDLPILNANGGPIAEAAARRREAAARFTALQAQVIGEIDRAAAAYATATQSLRAAEILSAQQADRRARDRRVFRAGALDHVTLLTGEIEYLQGRDARLGALVAQRKALGQLEDALRVPIFTPALPAPPVHDRTVP